MEILHKTIIEKRLENGYRNYRIPGVIVTDKGNIIIYYEARHGNDNSIIDIMMRKSEDGGLTWSDRKIIFDGENHYTSNNPVMIPDGDKIHFICMRDYTRCYYRYSTDEGETWSEPEDITYAFDMHEHREVIPRTVIAAGPGHGIKLHWGRLVVPVWIAYNPTDVHAHGPSCTSTITSNDGGKTWRLGELINHFTVKDPNEACICELPTGDVLINMRNGTNIKHRATAKSINGSWRWTKPEYQEELIDPCCAGGMCSYDREILFTNCESKEFRQELTLKRSHDFGKTWGDKLMYEKWGGYSDVNYDPVRKQAVLFYESEEGERRDLVVAVVKL